MSTNGAPLTDLAAAIRNAATPADYDAVRDAVAGGVAPPCMSWYIVYEAVRRRDFALLIQVLRAEFDPATIAVAIATVCPGEIPADMLRGLPPVVYGPGGPVALVPAPASLRAAFPDTAPEYVWPSELLVDIFRPELIPMSLPDGDDAGTFLAALPAAERAADRECAISYAPFPPGARYRVCTNPRDAHAVTADPRLPLASLTQCPFCFHAYEPYLYLNK